VHITSIFILLINVVAVNNIEEEAKNQLKNQKLLKAVYF